MSESNLCPQCGNVFGPDVTVCPQCGSATIPGQSSSTFSQSASTFTQSASAFTQSAPAAAGNPGQGKAIASLVLGILAVICIFLGYGALIGIVLAIVGIVLGTSAKKDAPSSMATAGVVLSIIALALCVISFIACVACIGAFAAMGAGL